VRFLGVDPGLLGAIAALDDAGRAIEVVPTPIILAPPGGRADYDLDGIRDVLERHLRAVGGAFVTVEKLHAMPMRFRKKGDSAKGEESQGSGVIANFNRGMARGWLWMLAGMGVPIERRELVLPQTWQRVMLVAAPGADTKAQSIAQARRLWPGVSLLRSSRARLESDGMADALHIAQWGRQQFMGGALFGAIDASRHVAR
jgi:hypothetical protein